MLLLPIIIINIIIIDIIVINIIIVIDVSQQQGQRPRHHDTVAVEQGWVRSSIRVIMADSTWITVRVLTVNIPAWYGFICGICVRMLMLMMVMIWKHVLGGTRAVTVVSCLHCYLRSCTCVVHNVVLCPTVALQWQSPRGTL